MKIGLKKRRNNIENDKNKVRIREHLQNAHSVNDMDWDKF